MIDLTSFRFNFEENAKASQVTKNDKVISKGKSKARMQITGDESKNLSIAIHSTFSYDEIKLNAIERQYMVIAKVKNRDGVIGYVKVNANSLKKRLGYDEGQLKGMMKNPEASKSLLLNKINNIRGREMVSTNQESNEVDKLQNTAKYINSNSSLNSLPTYHYSDGSTYVGKLKDGLPNGQGISTWLDGKKYVGNFEKGAENGHGTLTWLNGEKYEGNFKDGIPDGLGTHTWPEGDRCTGTFKKGSGNGTYTWPNGVTYTGEFKDNQLHGEGKWFSMDGTTYVGQFENGKRHGQGKLTKSDGTVSEGRFENGVFVG